MKKLVRNIMLIGAMLFVSGCDFAGTTKNTATSHSVDVDSVSKVYVYCDRQMGIEYLIYDGYKAGGMTVRRNSEGFISHCEKE